MQYVLTFNHPQAEIERLVDPATCDEAMAPWNAYIGAIVQAGILRGGERLMPPWTATTVRLKDGKRHVQDGPFAETQEQATGFVVIEVESLDEAIAWAERSPSARSGSTEVRPTVPNTQRPAAAGA